MQRREFMSLATASAGGVLASSRAALGQPAPAPPTAAAHVPMEVSFQPAWLSWVAATGACLRALGVDCDNADVAGYSGYAFHMNVPPQVDVSGPTSFPWGDLASGIRSLGRSTLELKADEVYDEPNMGEAFALAGREVKAGRPCVLWGIEMPEFCAVVGVEGDEFIYRWAGQPASDQRLQYTKVQCPAGPYVLAFPTATPTVRVVAGRVALVNALSFLHRRPGRRSHHFGLAAYDSWIVELEAGSANGFGNSYCAQCFGEAKGFSRDFLTRLADRNTHAAGPLDKALLAYGEVADAMQRVAQLFPFPGAADQKVADLVTIGEAVESLKAARDAETRAAAALEEALEVEWPDR